MHHRYGRHGPHAWLRQRMRRYARPSLLPIPVESPPIVPATTIRVFVPVTTERIIFIIMSDGNINEARRNQEGRELSVVVSDYELQDTRDRREDMPMLNHLKKIAGRRATEDVEEIRSKMRGGRYVILDREHLEDRVARIAKEDIPDDYLKDISYRELRKEYEDAYHREFDEEVRHLAARLVEIKDEKEKQLRATLSQDRHLAQTHDQGDWHIRDLVLIRILQAYYTDHFGNIHLGNANIVNILLEQHALIDRYADYVKDFEERNEVIWPDEQGPFRTTK